MKNKFIIAIFLIAFLLIAPNVKAANFTDYQTVDVNKTWTIKFTGEVGFDDDTKQGITVMDSKGKPVSVDIELRQDSKTVTVTAPTEGYTVGESYILNIGTKVHSNKGKKLKKEYNLHFNVKSNLPTAVAIDLTTIDTDTTSLPKSTIVTFKLSVPMADSASNYTVTVKGKSTQYNSTSDRFGVCFDGTLSASDFKISDFVVTKNH